MVLWFMMMLIGAEGGLEGHYLLRQLGAGNYVGLFTAVCNLKICGPEMWGWIFAAKIGCGLVAELGSMRISEEIDAMEGMGVPSRAYLVTTRVLAALLAAPFLYLVGMVLMNLVSYLVVVGQLKTVSSGGYLSVFWAFQTPVELLYSVIWIMVLTVVIVLVGCYFGFTATGGPVGVGKNTAKSMLVNMFLVSFVGMVMNHLLFGIAKAPIAN